MSLAWRVAAALLVWALAAPMTPAASAQEIGTPPVPVVDVSAGYMFMRDTSNDVPGHDGINFPKGWYFSSAVNATRWFGIVGEVGGSHKQHLDMNVESLNVSNRVQLYTFLGGPRFFHQFGRVVPFGQVLAGVAHTRVKTTLPPELMAGAFKASTTNVAVQPGGGVTVLLTDNLGVRAAADYRSIVDFVTGGPNDYTHEFRVTTGFTMQWGRR